MSMRFLSLFSGIGGMDLGLERAGMTCVGQVEIDPYCRRVLAKHWPDVPKFGDIREFRGDEIEGPIDLIAGGFPCQDISHAGKRAGITGERSGLWTEMLRIIRVVRPRFVLVENVAALLVRGMGIVLAGLAESGFDAEWSLFPACALGTPHSRERLFLVAYADKERRRLWRDRMPDATRRNHWKATQGQRDWRDVERWLRQTFQNRDRAATHAAPVGVVDGIPRELECGMYGNAVVPQVAEFIGRAIIAADTGVAA